MSQRKGEALTYKCVGCGNVFDVRGNSQGQMVLSDRPVSGGSGPGGGNMGAEGIAMVVAAKGPDIKSAEPDEWPAIPCPRCGRLN